MKNNVLGVFQSSVVNLICFLAFLSLLLVITRLRLDLSSTQNSLTRAYKEFGGFEKWDERPQFNVANLGDSVEIEGSKEFCGIYLIRISDNEKYSLRVECFDGETQKLKSGLVPLEGSEISLSICTDFQEGKPVTRDFTFQKSDEQFILSFAIPYLPYFYRNLKPSHGFVHEEPILVMFFFDELSPPNFQFPESLDDERPESWDVEKLQRLAIEQKTKVVYCRFERNDGDITQKLKLQREEGIVRDRFSGF